MDVSIRLPGQETSRTCMSLLSNTRVIDTHPIPGFFSVPAGDVNSDPQVHTANTLTTEPSCGSQFCPTRGILGSRIMSRDLATGTSTNWAILRALFLVLFVQDKISSLWKSG